MVLHTPGPQTVPETGVCILRLTKATGPKGAGTAHSQRPSVDIASQTNGSSPDTP